MGFGLAVAVILDATLVRMGLVSAGMKQLGYKNRYFRNWLEWLHKVSIEGNAGKRLAEER